MRARVAPPSLPSAPAHGGHGHDRRPLQRPAEQRQPCDRWNRRAIQLSDRADHHVAVDRLGCAIAGAGRYVPAGSLFIEFRCCDLGSEADVLVQIISIQRQQ